MILVFFQSPKELRLCKCYVQLNFYLHRTQVEQRRVAEESFLILPLAVRLSEFQTINWNDLFQFYAEVLLWLPVISLAVNSSTNFSGRRAVS